MIKKILTVGLFATAMIVSAQQINNNGFEAWSGSPNAPDYWGTIDKAIANSAFGSFVGATNFVTQSSSPYAGSSAINLTTQTIAIGTYPAAAIYGDMELVGTSGIAFTGQPYTSQPGIVTYAIKGTIISGDSVPTIVLLTHWNTSTNQRDTVGGGIDYVNSSEVNASSYMLRTFYLTYGSSQVPDTMQYIISSSVVTSSPSMGTSVTIDDIQFSGSMGIAANKTAPINVVAYPNPTVNQLTISSSEDKAKNVSIYDLTGRLMSKKELQNKQTNIDVSSFENGIYIYVITDKNNSNLFTSKFNVAK